jgi:hypothetical protein
MPRLKTLIGKKGYAVGKYVFNFLYVHRDYIIMLPIDLQVRIEEADIIHDECMISGTGWNVAKLNPKGYFGVTLLNYPSFWKVPHPELERYYTVHPEREGCDRINMGTKRGTILHRKELLIGSGNAFHYHKWAQLTKEEEEHGLFDKEHLSHIGRKTYWEALLANKNLFIESNHVHRYPK